MNIPIGETRERTGVEADLLRAYCRIENKRYPGDEASCRIVCQYLRVGLK
ncbi:MAG: hypothetical protein P8166_00575 [Candidatus Thiodiazotropha sp.]